MWLFAMLDQVHLRAATYAKNAKNERLIARWGSDLHEKRPKCVIHCPPGMCFPSVLS